MKTRTEIIAAIETTGLATCNNWNDRVYVNLHAADRSYTGCRTHKIWIDGDGRLHVTVGRGSTPSAYDAAIETLEGALGVDLTLAGKAREAVYEIA